MVDKRPAQLLGIAVIGLAIGLSFGLTFYALDPGSCDDVDGFGKLGAAFARHGNFLGSIRRAPAYPFVLGVTYRLFGVHNHHAVIVVQSLFLAGIGLSVFAISLAFFGSRKPAVWTAVLTMLHPLTWWYVPRLWAELLFALFVIWTVHAAALSLRAPSVKHSALFGATIGLASLTKPVMLLFPVFLASVAGMIMAAKAAPLRHFRRKDFLVFLIVPVLAMTAVIFPWTLRNKAVSGRWIPVSSNVGLEFFRGNVYAEENVFLLKKTIPEIWEVSRQKERQVLRERGYPEGVDPGPAEIDAVFNPLMKDFILGRPGLFLLKIARQIPAFWIRGETFAKSMVFLGVAVLTLAMFFGGVLKFRDKIPVVAVLSCVVYFNLVYAAVLAWARYSMPVYPVMMLVAVPFALGLFGRPEKP